jgi:hypothetical protein
VSGKCRPFLWFADTQRCESAQGWKSATISFEERECMMINSGNHSTLCCKDMGDTRRRSVNAVSEEHVAGRDWDTPPSLAATDIGNLKEIASQIVKGQRIMQTPIRSRAARL